MKFFEEPIIEVEKMMVEDIITTSLDDNELEPDRN